MKQEDEIVKSLEFLASLEKADQKRAHAYAHDLGRGLKIARTFPQGVTVFGSARIKEQSIYYKKARELGRLLAENGHAVITGGGPGVMEGANRGAYEYGGRSIGLNITLPHEQQPNPYLTDTLEFNYFFARKVILAMAGKVYVFFPGGFGTLDETSEILLLIQEGKMPQMPVFLFGKKFWKPFDKFISTSMLSKSLIGKNDQKIYKITDDIQEIVRAANKIGHPKVKTNYYDSFKKAKIPHAV